MRVKVTTTLRRDLWEALQIDALKKRCDTNDTLETLIADYLKKSKKGGR